MSTRGAGAISIVTLLLAAAAWLVWSYVDSAPPGAPSSATADPDQDVVDPAIRSPSGEEPAAVRTAVEPRPVSTAPQVEDEAEKQRAVFRGRVIDADGAPLAGVTAAVHGWVANDERQNAYLAEHGEIVWEDPPKLVTGPDGRFEIAFVPPPPYQFVLDLEADSRVGVGGRWGTIEAGKVKDFGDVTMLPGAHVRGRLVDAAGRQVPRPGNRMQLSINRYNRRDAPRGELVTEESARADVAADGSFEMRKPVAPGTWNLSIQGLLPRERNTEFVVEAPRTALDVLVFRPEELLRVAGVVVDGAGDPVPGAQFSPVAAPTASNWILSADRQGRFEFEQRPDAVDPKASFRLRFERIGYEATTTGELTFGQRDVRVVMKRIAAMEVLVVRADDGLPVTEYGLRVMNTDGGFSSRERDVIDGWSHEAGIVRVQTMQRGGMKRIVVEPRKGSGLAMTVTRVEVDVDAPPRLTINLPPAIAQVVRIERADGTPVTGSQVELIDAEGEELSVVSHVTVFGANGFSTNENGLQIDRAETDVSGRCEVAGPKGQPLTLRVFGEHPPLVVNGYQIGDDPLVLQVAEGATLRVTLDPPELLAEWRLAAGLPERGTMPDERRDSLPAVGLQRALGAYQDNFPLGRMLRGVPFDDAGVAVLRHVPPGTWTLRCWWQETPERSAQRTATHPAPVELTDGAEVAVVVDVSAYRTATVSGTVVVDGKPAADLRLTLRRPAVVPEPDMPRYEDFSITLDAGGAFRRALPAGIYQAIVTVRTKAGHPEQSPFASVHAEPDFTVAIGAPVEVALTATIGRVRLRFVDPAGLPVAGLQLWSTGGDWLDRPSVPPTDGDGVTTVVGTPGSCALGCRVRSVKDQASYQERQKALLDANGGNWDLVQREMNGLVVQLPPVALTPGTAGEPQEIRLPEEWDR